MSDQFLPFRHPSVHLIALRPHIRDGVAAGPRLAGPEATEAVRRASRTRSKDDQTVVDQDVEPVARLDPERGSRLARHDDLVLGADLDA
jgi:hypothetical protein